MPIEGVSNVIRMPRLGKLRLGIKVEGEGKKSSYPRATDHFVVPKEVAAVYGPEPKELDIMFPTEDVQQFAQQWLRRYSMTQGLVCIGDGVTARRKVDTKTGAMAGRDTQDWEWKDGLTCNPQECDEYLTKRCRRVMNLQILLPNVRPGLGVWQIDTSSFHSIININSMAALLRDIAGRCSFIPLKLCLGPIQVSPAGQKTKTVFVMHVRQDSTLAEIARIGLQSPVRALLPEPDTEKAPDDLFPDEIMEEERPKDNQDIPGNQGNQDNQGAPTDKENPWANWPSAEEQAALDAVMDEAERGDTL